MIGWDTQKTRAGSKHGINFNRFPCPFNYKLGEQIWPRKFWGCGLVSIETMSNCQAESDGNAFYRGRNEPNGWMHPPNWPLKHMKRKKPTRTHRPVNYNWCCTGRKLVKSTQFKYKILFDNIILKVKIFRMMFSLKYMVPIKDNNQFTNNFQSYSLFYYLFIRYNLFLHF